MRSKASRAADTDFQEMVSQLARERRSESILYAAASSANGPRSSPDSRSPSFSHVAIGVEIACVLSGAVVVVTPAEIFRLTPSKLLIIERGVQHTELPGNSRRTHRTFWYHLYQTRVHLWDSRFVPPRDLIVTPLDLPGRSNVERIGQAVCSELSAQHVGYQRAVFGLLTYLSCLIIRRLRRAQFVPVDTTESPAPIGANRSWQAVQSAVEFCEQNFRKGVTRDDAAKALGYNSSYLGQLVSSHLGHSLSEYLTTLRIAEGKRLLEETELTIREVASSVGYVDPAHFTRAFTRVAGLSPTAYRRQFELF
ncbi:MAG: helix-turn-helix domain-containing protein [Armatimonadota bacterium]|jgi:AraC-like DNA-binding protein